MKNLILIIIISVSAFSHPVDDSTTWKDPLWSTFLFPTSSFLPYGKHFNLRLTDTNIQLSDRYLFQLNHFLFLAGKTPNLKIKIKLSNKLGSFYNPTIHYFYYDLSVMRKLLLIIEEIRLSIFSAFFGGNFDIDIHDVKNHIHQFGFSNIKYLSPQTHLHITGGDFYIQDYVEYTLNDSTYVNDNRFHVPFLGIGFSKQSTRSIDNIFTLMVLQQKNWFNFITTIGFYYHGKKFDFQVHGILLGPNIKSGHYNKKPIQGFAILNIGINL